LTSTYPRWADDSEPGFVHELCHRLVDNFDVRVVGPHAPGALNQETMDNVEIRRYRYAPVRLQTLVNDGGIVTNLKRQPWKWLLLPGFLLGQLWTTWRQIRRWRPDVVHAHWLIPQGLTAALICLLVRDNPPLLVTSHGTDMNGLRFWPMPGLKRLVIRQAAGATIVSSGMLSAMKGQGLCTDRVAIEPMGADLKTRFTPDNGISRSSHELLFVGRLVEVKGVRFLIAAMPEIIENHPGARLTVAGFGPEERNLRKQAQSLGIRHKVRFIGAVPQKRLPELYRRAAVFVAPFVETSGGHQEGLGLVTIEAIGCGCLAVVSDLPATRDVIEDDAFRFTPASVEGIAKSISKALAMSPDHREHVAKAQRKNVVPRFDWQARAASYGQLLRSLLRSP